MPKAYLIVSSKKFLIIYSRLLGFNKKLVIQLVSSNTKKERIDWNQFDINNEKRKHLPLRRKRGIKDLCLSKLYVESKNTDHLIKIDK